MKTLDFLQLKIEYTDGFNAFSYCPFHCDKKRPNLCISIKEKYYGNFICWACGRNGRLDKWQMDKLSLLESIPHKNNGNNLLTRWKQFTESCCDNLKKFPLLKLGLAKQLNISTKSLDDWLVGYDGQSFTVPMIREDLSEYYRERGFCGIQRRFSDGTKRCVAGSRLGLMYPRKIIGDYYIFICEGFSDAVSVWDLGLQSIARPHCRYIDGIREFFNEVIDDENVEHIIIIPDNDTVGREGAEKLQDELEGLCYYVESDWEEDCNIAIFSFDGAEDVRQLIQLKGKDYVKQELENYI